MSPLNLSENKARATDNSNNNNSSRSKKCLDMALMSSKKATPAKKSIPLSELSNIPCGVPTTPTSSVRALSPFSPSSLFLSSSSPGQDSVRSPMIQPKTPRSVLKSLEVPVPKSAGSSFVLQITTAKSNTSPEPSITKTSPIPQIVTTSFYSNMSTPKSQTSATSASIVKSQPPKRRSSAGGSLSRHRSRSSGGNKRKRVARGGVGHNIKKPKFRLNPESSKQGNVSVQRGFAKEKQSPRCSSSKASPTSGQLSLTNQTKIQFEVRGGKVVYRTKAKTATTPKTPLRRSPRKMMSPLKADYFSSSVKERGKGKGGKLFSPNTNFFTPDEFSPLKSSLPSPVRFSNSVKTKEGDHNLSELITSLAKDQLGELDQDVISKPPEQEVPDVIPRPPHLPSKFSSTSSNMPDVSKAVSNILNDLSSGDDSISDTDGNIATSSVEKPSSEESSTSKLYPIFYKTTAHPGDGKETLEKELPNDKKFLCSSLSDNQTIIDAGQKTIGATLCLTCGVVYSVGDPQDEKQHSLLHAVLMDKLRLAGWKTERLVGQFTGGRVVCVKPGDHPMHWRKAEEVLTVVDSDLGFSEVGIRWPDKSKVFLYAVGKKIVGFLLAECIEQAFPIIPNEDADVNGKVFYCSEVGQPVKCGISRIWVLAGYRRSKVASSLVDCMRSSFIQNHYLNKTEFAFSDPTLNGIKFTSSYMKSDRFLVYNR